MTGEADSPSAASRNDRADGDGDAPIQLDYVAVPDDLKPYFTTFFLFRCDVARLEDIQPAAMGQLQFYFAGVGGPMHFAGRTDRTTPVTLMAPPSAAAPFEITGPMRSFGAVLGPLGWAAFTGLAADEYADRLVDAETVFGPEIEALRIQLAELFAADPEMDGTALAAPLAEFLRPRLRPLPAGHVALVHCVVDWLGSALTPDVNDLYARSGYSPRQAQRLVARYFGSSPKHLIRKYRATRIVALLGQPNISDEQVAALVDEYYDQPHMIREIREFIGRTPARFGDGETPIMQAMVNVRNFYQIKPHVAPIPEGLVDEAPAD